MTLGTCEAEAVLMANIVMLMVIVTMAETVRVDR
jgi:hypothetical protein